METRGEFVILIEGNTSAGISDKELSLMIDNADYDTKSLSELTAYFAETTGCNRNKIKQLILNRKSELSQQ
jgi:16S rRNA C1402 (ribose-2'-O) methylase RsmI